MIAKHDNNAIMKLTGVGKKILSGRCRPLNSTAFQLLKTKHVLEMMEGACFTNSDVYFDLPLAEISLLFYEIEETLVKKIPDTIATSTKTPAAKLRKLQMLPTTSTLFWQCITYETVDGPAFLSDMIELIPTWCFHLDFLFDMLEKHVRRPEIGKFQSIAIFHLKLQLLYG